MSPVDIVAYATARGLGLIRICIRCRAEFVMRTDGYGQKKRHCTYACGQAGRNERFYRSHKKPRRRPGLMDHEQGVA